MPNTHSMTASVTSSHSTLTNVTNFTKKRRNVPLCCSTTTFKTSKAIALTVPTTFRNENVICRTLKINKPLNQNSYDQNNHQSQQFSRQNLCTNNTKFIIIQNILWIITVNRSDSYQHFVGNNEIQSLTTTEKCSQNVNIS